MNRFSLALLLLLPSVATQAQDLRLFEEIEGVPVVGPQPVQPTVVAPVNSQPAFTLRSVSRFGDRYEAVLLDRGSQPVRVSWREGESASVPGFGGFMVQAAGNGTLTLVHPPLDPCIPAQASGVSCATGNSATLSLVAAKALALNGTPPQPQPVNVPQGQQGQVGRPQNDPVLGIRGMPVQADFVSASADGTGPAVYLNPFSGQVEQVPQVSNEERQARAERQMQRSLRLRQFEPARIDPASLPPGTRIESTPFGDRIVRE